MCDETPPPEPFFWSFTLGMPIPLDSCPASFIEEDSRALTEYLRDGNIFRAKPLKKPDA